MKIEPELEKQDTPQKGCDTESTRYVCFTVLSLG